MSNTEECNCTRCAQSSIVPEIPGEYRDFDADEDLHGTCGAPLCSSCLGTGRQIDSAEFSMLGDEVRKIRRENFGIQMKANENKNWRIQVEANNKRLVEIAKEALGMVSEPVENCLATKLIKGEW